MSAPQTLSLVLLLACLVLAVWRRMNIGMLALAACVPVLLASGADPDKMYENFPGDLFTLIAGVALLFAHLERSGALRSIVNGVFRIVGDRVAVLPWACFVLAAAFTSLGAFSTAPIALLVPMVAYVSVRYPRMFFLNEMGVVIGANAAGLSPLNPTGEALHKALDKSHTTYNGWGVWAISVTVAVIAMAGLQVAEGLRNRRGGVPTAPGITEASVEQEEVTQPVYAIASVVGLLFFVVGVVVFHLDKGVTPMLVAVVLQFAFRPDEKALINRVPWNAILLLCGLLTYLGLVKDIGTMDAIQHGLTKVGTPALLVLVLAYLAALLCNIESSTIGVLTLVGPLIGSSFTGNPAITLIVAAVAAPAALTVMNPVHVAGTLIVANTAPEQQSRTFARLFATSVSISAVAPAVLGLIAIALM